MLRGSNSSPVTVLTQRPPDGNITARDMAIESWSNQRVLVTGGRGFLGPYVLAGLAARGCDAVVAPARTDYDFRVPDDVRRAYRDFRPTMVIHLAAVVGGIGANQQRPAEFFYDNLMMGTQLLDQAWRTGVQKFVAIGTVCAYPSATPVPFREADLWNGYPEATNAPYGLAKKMLLVQSDAYRRQYGFNSIFLLPANLYGRGDHFDEGRSHVIPALIRRCAEARGRGAGAIEVWGDGTATREFLYAADAAEGILLASERYDSSEPVNLGSGFEISIADLAHQIAECVGFRGRIVWNDDRPNGQARRRLDTSLAETQFGFRASTPFAEGLQRTVAWYESTNGRPA